MGLRRSAPEYGMKTRSQRKALDVETSVFSKSKRLQTNHKNQISKELAAENMSTHENVGVKRRIQGKAPDVKAAGIRKSERLRKKYDDQISKELAAGNMSARENVVGGKLKLKGKAAKIRKTKKLHKYQISKELAAGSRKGKESDVNQKTCYDGFLGKQVPVTEGEELGEGCAVCGAWDHFHVDCPCLKYFPKGTQIGVHFETMCLGCDRIGEVCCKKGGFALMKVCGYCWGSGHWQWEDSEDCSRPKDLVFEKPEFFYVMKDGEPIPMWLRT